MTLFETARLELSELTPDDDTFILRLLNEPSFLRYIGDRGVRTLEEARNYLEAGPIASYRENGFGLYRVARRDGGAVLGICGLVSRPALDDPDIGFAFLPEYWGKGYALEAATAILDDARRGRRFQRIVAITALDNHSSIRLLEKLGMHFESEIQLSGEDTPVKLFAWQADDEP